MKHDMDRILQQALSPDKEPDYWLNQRILLRSEEIGKMNRTGKKRVSTALLVAVLTLMLGSVSVFAAWKYLAPDEVADLFEDEGLSKAFQSEDAIIVNETQEYGGYVVTMLGIVSGKNLSEHVSWDDQGAILEDRTYVVTAIENADGTPRPQVSDEHYGEDSFLVSPIIKGLNPWEFNIMTMNGGYCEYIVDGIQYRIIECDNVEIFADRGLYLCVQSGTFYDTQAYIMDQTTGEVSRNEDYDGLNALFTLPLDVTNADVQAAQEYINQLNGNLWGDDVEGDVTEQDEPTGMDIMEDSTDVVSTILSKIENWTLEDYENNMTCVDHQNLTVDNDGFISYRYQHEGGEFFSMQAVSEMFEEGQMGLSSSVDIHETGENEIYVSTFTREADGTIILRIYYYEYEK